MVDVELLKKFSLFKNLDKWQLQKFVAYVKEKNYSERQDRPGVNYIYSKGDWGTEIFLIKKGRVSVELPLYREDSKNKTISEIGEGNFFGELSFFDGRKRSASVVAKGDVELLVLSRRDYDKVVNKYPEVGCLVENNIITGLIGIIRKMNEAYSMAILDI